MKQQFLEASNLFWVSFLILDGPPPLKLVLISPSSCCALKPPRPWWGRLDQSQSAKSISLEMEAVWSSPILTTSVWTEEEFIASLVPFPVAVNYQRLKSQPPLALVAPASPLLSQQKQKKKKKLPKAQNPPPRQQHCGHFPRHYDC